MRDRRTGENSKYAPRATVLLVSLFDFYISLLRVCPSELVRVLCQHPPHLAVHSSLARELSAYKSARSSSFNYSLCVVRELTNRRLLHDAAVRLRDMLTAHAFLSTCQLYAKVDDVGESDLPASWRQEDVKLVFKVFSRYFEYFCQII